MHVNHKFIFFYFRTYIILAPRKFRPGQVYQVSVSALRLVYKQLTIRVSVKHSYGNVNDEFNFVTGTFTRPSTRILQLKVGPFLKYTCSLLKIPNIAHLSLICLPFLLQIPETLNRKDDESYWLHVRGSVTAEGGLLFENRTKLEFEPKKVSLFIQTSKLLYHQGQVSVFLDLIKSHLIKNKFIF